MCVNFSLLECKLNYIDHFIQFKKGFKRIIDTHKPKAHNDDVYLVNDLNEHIKQTNFGCIFVDFDIKPVGFFFDS